MAQAGPGLTLILLFQSLQRWAENMYLHAWQHTSVCWTVLELLKWVLELP